MLGDHHVLAAGLEALPALEHLKTLHLGQSQSLNLRARYAALALGPGHRLLLPEADLHRFRRALEALRQARPEIVIDGDLNDASLQGRQDAAWWLTGYDTPLVHDVTWLPVADAPPMTAFARAVFKREGWWANFQGAGRPEKDGRVIVVSF